MTQENYALTTRVGRLKEAQRMAGQSVPAITHMAFGDADRYPTGSETRLTREVHRAALTNWGIEPGATSAFFDCYLPAEVGGFVIREIGLFDADGALIAIGRRSPGLPKTTPDDGGGDDFTVRMNVFFEEMDTLVVKVSPISGLTADNLPLHTFPSNLPIDGIRASPPGSPTERGQWIVSETPTGAWVGRENQIARYKGGVWTFEVPRAGRVSSHWSGGRLVTRRFDGAAWAEGREYNVEVNVARIVDEAGLALATDDSTALLRGIRHLVRSSLFQSQTTAGTAVAMVLNPAPPMTTEAGGIIFVTNVRATNTGPVTLKVSDLAPAPLLRADGEPLVAGDLQSGEYVMVISQQHQTLGFHWRVVEYRLATESRPGLAEFATVAETIRGTDTTRAVHPQALKAAYVPRQASLRTLYVRPDGSNDNDGSTNTAAGALRQISAAAELIRNMFPGGQKTRIVCAAGIYEPVTFRGFAGHAIDVIGAGIGSSFIDAGNTQDGCSAYDACEIYCTGFTVLNGLRSFSCFHGGVLNIAQVFADSPSARALYAADGGHIRVIGAMQVRGTMEGFAAASFNSAIYASDQTITLIGTPRFTGEFAQAATSILTFSDVTFVGSATGRRYYVLKLGLIDVRGKPITYLPGDAAGVTSDGGIYT